MGRVSSLLLVWLACLPAWCWAAPASDGPAQLSDVRVTHDGVNTVVLVVTSPPVKPSATALSNSSQLVLDFDQARYVWRRTVLDVPGDPVRDVRGCQVGDGVTRLVIELAPEAPYAIRTEDGVPREAAAIPSSCSGTARGDLADVPPPPVRPAAPSETLVQLATHGAVDALSPQEASAPVTALSVPAEDTPGTQVASGPVEGQSLEPPPTTASSETAAGLAEDSAADAPSPREASAPVLALPAPVEERWLALESQPSVLAAFADDLPPTPVASPKLPAWWLGFLRLELPAFHDSWDLAPPEDPPSFRLETSLSQKGSGGVGDELWNRVGFQSSRVDLMTGSRISLVGDLVHQLPYSLTWDTPGKEAPQALRLGFSEASQRWEYGLEYRSLDPRFERFAGSDLKRDEATVQTWAGLRLGPLKARGFASQIWNNLAEDPTKDRTTKVLGGARVELALPWSTWFNVSYARGTEERSRDFVSAAQRRRLNEIPRTSNSSVETMSGSLYHWAETWDISLSSSYSPSQDADNLSQQTVSLSQDLSVTLKPTEKVGSTATVSLWQERQAWTGYQSDGSTASLSLWYGPFLEGYTLALWGSYDRGRSSDGSWNSQSVNASAALSRRLGRTFLGDAWLSLELGYNLYVDAVSATSSSDELYGRVALKLLDF